MQKKLQKKLFDSENACVVLSRKVTKSNYFKIFIIICIFLNMITLAIRYRGINS